MITAMVETGSQQYAIAVGLQPEDIDKLRRDEPLSFLLSDVHIEGPAASQQVLIRYASVKFKRMLHSHGRTLAESAGVRFMIAVDEQRLAILEAGDGYLVKPSDQYRIVLFQTDGFDVVEIRSAFVGAGVLDPSCEVNLVKGAIDGEKRGS